MKVPVEAIGVVVKPIGELASPSAGGATEGGRLIATPVGALPTQAVEKVMGELNPSIEATRMLAPPLRP
jgi:hypothetical protein